MEPASPPSPAAARLLRAIGFALNVAGIAACFSPLAIGWWSLGGIGAVDAGIAVAITGWLLLIAAYVLHRRGRTPA